MHGTEGQGPNQGKHCKNRLSIVSVFSVRNKARFPETKMGRRKDGVRAPRMDQTGVPRGGPPKGVQCRRGGKWKHGHPVQPVCGSGHALRLVSVSVSAPE